ncbi:MAG: MGMT family protein [Minisyncoccia bacterium]
MQANSTERENASMYGSKTARAADVFAKRVLAAVRRIPKGETRSYGDIAKAVGRPRAQRAVGTVIKKNFDPTVPCHRVIRANGELGRYNRGDARKRELLEAEGAL